MKNENGAHTSSALEIAYQEFSRIEKVRKIEKNDSGNIETWEISTLVEREKDDIIDIQLFIYFSREFPYRIPTICLNNEKAPESLKGKPHIFPSGFICTFDPDMVVTDSDNPFGIVYDCFQRAKKIIEDGLQGKNMEDYLDEFLPYWYQAYYKGDDVVSVLSVITENKLKFDSLELTQMQNKVGSFDLILHDKSLESEQFFFNLGQLDVKKKENYTTLFVGSVEIGLPPYNFTNQQIIEIVKSSNDTEVHRRFIEYVNKYYEKPLIIIFKTKLKNDSIFLGWKLEHPKKNRDGFRAKNLSPYKVISELDRHKRTHLRLSTTPYDSERVFRRTAGGLEIVSKYKNSYSFSVVGTGSIGSNLIYFLKSLGIKEFRFIDPDTLSVENIGRHILGMSYVGQPKVTAMQNILVSHSPNLIIRTKASSVFEVVNAHPEFLNETDYIFIAIGKYNVENWLIKQHLKNVITKPIFIFWVEPYLTAGHMVYISSHDTVSFEDIHVDTLFRFNVISENAYKNDNEFLTLKEAGCHTSFVPYSNSNILMFLSAIFPKITEIISDDKSMSRVISWIGPIDILEELGVERSPFGTGLSSGQVIEHDLSSIRKN